MVVHPCPDQLGCALIFPSRFENILSMPLSVSNSARATSSCCRKCMNEWYDIDRNRPLTDEEIDYFLELIMLYIKDRLSTLPEIGESVQKRK